MSLTMGFNCQLCGAMLDATRIHVCEPVTPNPVPETPAERERENVYERAVEGLSQVVFGCLSLRENAETLAPEDIRKYADAINDAAQKAHDLLRYDAMKDAEIEAVRRAYAEEIVAGVEKATRWSLGTSFGGGAMLMPHEHGNWLYRPDLLKQLRASLAQTETGE